jgi:hypothetical protein
MKTIMNQAFQSTIAWHSLPMHALWSWRSDPLAPTNLSVAMNRDINLFAIMPMPSTGDAEL